MIAAGGGSKESSDSRARKIPDDAFEGPGMALLLTLPIRVTGKGNISMSVEPPMRDQGAPPCKEARTFVKRMGEGLTLRVHFRPLSTCPTARP